MATNLPPSFLCVKKKLSIYNKLEKKKRTELAAKSLQSCPTLCDPIDDSPPGSPVPGILQARTLEWVAISFSNVWKWKVKVKSLSRVRLLATPWTAAHQAPPSMGFSRQEDWSGVPWPSLGPSFGLHKQSVLPYIKAHLFPMGPSMASLRFLELTTGWITALLHIGKVCTSTVPSRWKQLCRKLGACE